MKMKISNILHPSQDKSGTNAFKGGSYSLMMTGIVITLAIVINILVNILPDTVTKHDISASQLYSVSSNTKAVLSQLDDDVNIYWIVQADKDDSIIENLLEQYEYLSDHITVTKKDPDVYPTFASQYTDEDVPNNSLVVESGDRSRFISYDDIYLNLPDVAAQTVNSSFDGEGAITSAIDYVVNEEQPKIYYLEGHGEADIPSCFSDQIIKSNMELHSLSLLTVDTIPEDASCVMIYAPESDISEEEVSMLSKYVQGGGKLFVSAGPTTDGSLANLYSILKPYGVTTMDGVVIESDRAKFAFRQPYSLIPTMPSSSLTDSLIEEHYSPIFPISQALLINDMETNENVTPLLMAGDTAYNKIKGVNLDTYDFEDGDTYGPFSLAVKVHDNNGGDIIWFASSAFLDDVYNAYSSGANVDLAVNSITSLIGETEAMAIRTKSLNYNYLTISESAASMLKIVMIGIIPLAYLGIGIAVVLRRKRRLNKIIA